MSTQYWWDRFPGRLQFELDALGSAGIAYERNEHAFSQGVMQLRLSMEIRGERLSLLVTFPDLYPYFRFEVEAPDLSLSHHQNPFAKNLCLIGRGTHYWHSTDTVAGLLQQQLPVVLETSRTSDAEAVRGREQAQAEPFSDFYPYAPSMIIIDGEWIAPPHQDRGTFSVATDGAQGPPPLHFLRGALAQVRGEASSILFEADPTILSAFPSQLLEGYWVRFPEPIRHTLADPFMGQLFSRFPSARTAPANRVQSGWLQVWGILFPEETGWRQNGDGWVFVYLFNAQRAGLVQAQAPPRRSEPERRNRKKRRKR